MPKVLLVAYDFPPRRTSAVYWPVGLARHLAAHGWQTHVLTVRNPPPGLRDPALLTKLGPEVRIHLARTFELFRLEDWLHDRFFGSHATASPAASPVPVADTSGSPDPQARRPGAIKRILSWVRRTAHEYLYIPDRYSGWWPCAVTVGTAVVVKHRIDVILSISAPQTSQFVGAMIAGLTRRPFVADFTDPWTTNWTQRSHGAFRTRLERGLERRVLRRARRIIHVSEWQRRLSLAAFPEVPERKHTVLRGGFDESDFQELPPQGGPHAEPGTLDILSVGTIYTDSTFSTVVEAMKRLAAHPGTTPRMHLTVVGFMPSDIRRQLESPQLAPMVTDRGFHPHREALAWMVGAQVILLTIPRGWGVGSNIPGRLYEMARSGRPVIFVGDHPEIEEVLRRIGRGYHVPDGDVDRFIEVLGILAAGQPSSAPQPGPDFVGEFEWHQIAGRMAGLLEGARTGEA